MKSFITILAAFLLVAATGCGGTDEHEHHDHSAHEMQNDNRDHAAMHAAEADTSARYACPMNCVEPQSEPGRCSVCGMNLVKEETESQDGDATESAKHHNH